MRKKKKKSKNEKFNIQRKENVKGERKVKEEEVRRKRTVVITCKDKG